MENKNLINDLPDLSDPNLKSALSQYGKIYQFKADQVILNDGDFISSIPIVLSGSLRVSRLDEDGNELLLYYIYPGESCIMSFLGGIHHDTSKIRAVVQEDSELVVIPIQYVSEWLKKYPDWMDYVFKLYHKRFEELLKIVNEIAFQKVDERLIDLLKKKSTHSENKELTITHQQLANDLGTAREVVSRLLKQMENQGKVSLARNKIVLKKL